MTATAMAGRSATPTPTAITSAISYSPASQALPTSVTDTNPAPFHWQTTTTMNQGRQLPTATTDVNGEVTTETYDALGRLMSVTTPIDQGTGDPTYTYSYHLTGKVPSAVTTSTLREDGSYSQSVSLYDGFAQLRQVQTDAAGQLRGPGDHGHLLRLARLDREDERSLL